MEIPAQVAPLREGFRCLHLDSLLRLPDVEEAGEGAVDVRVDVFPGLDMEHGVALRYFANDDPLSELTDLFLRFVRVGWHRRRRFESDWAHVVVVAVVDVCFVF